MRAGKASGDTTIKFSGIVSYKALFRADDTSVLFRNQTSCRGKSRTQIKHSEGTKLDFEIGGIGIFPCPGITSDDKSAGLVK